MRTSVKRKIPRAESPSKILFHSSHPSVRVLSPTSYESGKAERFVLSLNPWSKNNLLNFELNFFIISRGAIKTLHSFPASL
jgi:hypothetical protein